MYSYNKITEIDGLWLLQNKIFDDERGYFEEVFNKDEFQRNTLIEFNPVQINKSYSLQGVVRGLHFQKGEYAQAKIVRCTKGEILDVVMDIRDTSPTYGKIFKINLNEFCGLSLYVPKGFAHGFIAMDSTGNEIEYLVDAPYNKESEGGYAFPTNLLDNIGGEIRMSEKDKNWPELPPRSEPMVLENKLANKHFMTKLKNEF